MKSKGIYAWKKNVMIVFITHGSDANLGSASLLILSYL